MALAKSWNLQFSVRQVFLLGHPIWEAKESNPSMSYHDNLIKCEHSHPLTLSPHVHGTLFILVLPGSQREGHLTSDNFWFPETQIKGQRNVHRILQSLKCLPQRNDPMGYYFTSDIIIGTSWEK